MIERDYLMRLVQQLATVLTRIMRAKELEKYDEARETIKEAYVELFSLDSSLVSMMSSASLAELLGDRAKIKAMARLLKEEGELCELQQGGLQAMRHYQRALELYLEAVNSDVDAETTAMIKLLTDKVDGGNLSEGYRTILRKLSG